MDQATYDVEIEKILSELYKNNAKKIHQMVKNILFKIGEASKDYDDFYSVANLVCADIKKKRSYDFSRPFDDFLYGCLSNKIKTEIRNRNRIKRTIDRTSISLETIIGEDGNSTILDMVKSDFKVENEVFQDEELNLSSEMNKFLSRLNEKQKQIANLVMKGYSPDEIKKKLNLSDREYNSNWKIITSYENKRIFYKNDDMEDEKMNPTNFMDGTAESYKDTSYSISSISNQLRKKRIRDDHILQRHTGQWKSFAKSELISDIFRGKSLTQIIISEEIKNGVRMQWLIDGKQRCTTLDDYLHNGFAISKNVKNYNIKYQTTKLDADGEMVLNEEGFPIMEIKEFDIRGKKFSQLPEELQDIFKDRQIPVLYNMNCTKKDIADDIARFNRSRPMNKAQNGWLGLDECFAELVENIVKMKFFQTDFYGSEYTNNNHSSGAMRRIVVESIMVSDFLEDYNKDFDKMCTFLSEEASDSNFTEFYDLVERITSVASEKTAKVFNAKDSFLWFGLFSKFVKLGICDKDFICFVENFKDLKTRKINGISYKELDEKSTKDKYVVVEKLNHLETLMKEFLHIEDEEEYESQTSIEFVKSHVDSEVTEEDIEQYEEVLDSLTLNVDNSSRLMNKENRNSLIGMIAYSFKNDVDIDDWFVDYFKREKYYIKNQKKNYLRMVDDLNKSA